MARIRTIKPEILEDAVTAGLSDSAFRLFASAIVLADDYGNLQGDERWLRSQIWWAHEKPPRFAEILRELRQGSLVAIYEVRGQKYLHLKGWTKHQRIDNAGKPRVPRLDDPDAVEVIHYSDDDGASRGNPPRNSAKRRVSPLDPDLDPDPEGDQEGTSGKPDSPATRLWSEQERLRKQVMPKSRALEPTHERLDRIRKLLAAGVTEDDAIAVLGEIAEQVKRDPSSGKWFNGETNWRSSNFDRNLGSLGSLPQDIPGRHDPRNGLSSEQIGQLADELERQGR